jgi:hypothetical protein
MVLTIYEDLSFNSRQCYTERRGPRGYIEYLTSSTIRPTVEILKNVTEIIGAKI